MKKIFITVYIIILVVALTLSAISLNRYLNRYKNWQTVELPSGGSFKVPQEWVVTQEGYVIYITDKPIDEEDYKIYLIGTIYDEANTSYLFPYKLFKDVELIGEAYDVNYSNSGTYLLEEYDISGSIERKYAIDLFLEINLIAWDNLLDEDMIIAITKSYRPFK